MAGTTNITSIFGGEIYIVADGRVTKGTRIIHEQMQAHIRTLLEVTPYPSVKLVARWANDYFRESAAEALKEVGEEPEIKGEASWLSWEKRLMRWNLNNHNTLTFVCGFDDNEAPKVYLANDRYEVPLDISKKYSDDQIRYGITREEASEVIDKEYPHHLVRGSLSRKVTQFIEDSSVFKGIKDLFQGTMDLDEQRRLGDKVRFEEIAIEYSMALFYAAMNDQYTGGDFIVKRISRRGVSTTFEWNIVRVYLENFGKLEKQKVLFILLKSEDYNKMANYKIMTYFASLESKYYNCPELKVIGFLNDFVLYRLPSIRSDEYDSRQILELAYENVRARSVGDGPFEMCTINTGDFNMFVGKPTTGTLSSLIKL